MPANSSKIIDAKQFWELYFHNKFLRLERHPDKYIGEVFDKTSSSGKGLFDNNRIFVEVNMDDLRVYDYETDGRFTQLIKRPVKADDAVQAIINQSYPYRDAAPFGKERMSELFLQMYPSELKIDSLEILEGTTFALANEYNQDLSQPLAGHAWLLGEFRQRSSTKALLNIIHYAPFVSSAQYHLPFTPIDVAFSALWKINDKFALWDLLKLLPSTDDSGKRKIIPLFERLLSTNVLLSLTQHDDNYYETKFWENYLLPMKDFSERDWDSYDANSLFWELRYLSAIRLPLNKTDILNKLISDEVSIVSDIARKRLAT